MNIDELGVESITLDELKIIFKDYMTNLGTEQKYLEGKAEKIPEKLKDQLSQSVFNLEGKVMATTALYDIIKGRFKDDSGGDRRSID